MPEMFPNHGKFKWLGNSDYDLPGHREIAEEQKKVENEYAEKMLAIESRLEANKEKYKFLHDLLTETGNSLVSAVKAFLEWLGFENVFEMDDLAENDLEEDLRIETETGLLLIEIKGLGGTSKDSDCEQISKIRFRKIEELQRFDVCGLYIVNHQRYLPPKSRRNPPFTPNQINDAGPESGKRGLLTTYELYKSYFLIEQGLLTKEEVASRLFKAGLITLGPHLLSLGKPNELFRQGQVVIIKLEPGLSLKRGDPIYLKNSEGALLGSKIESLQKDGKDVPAITGDGTEVGIGLSGKASKTTELMIKPQGASG